MGLLKPSDIEGPVHPGEGLKVVGYTACAHPGGVVGAVVGVVIMTVCATCPPLPAMI